MKYPVYFFRFWLTLVLMLAINIASFGQVVKVILKLFESVDGKKMIYVAEKRGESYMSRKTFESNQLYDVLKKKIGSSEVCYDEARKIIKDFEESGKISTYEKELLEQEATRKAMVEIDSHVVGMNRMRKLLERKVVPITRTGLENIKHSNVFVSLPSDDNEFINIFNEFNASHAVDAFILRKGLEHCGNTNVLLPKTAADILSSIPKSNEHNKAIIIIGHNEDGAIKFPDKSKLKISDLDALAQKHSRVIVYLSCNSASFTSNPATGYFLTYDQAINVANRLDFFVPNPLMASHDHIREEFQKIVDTYGKSSEAQFYLRVTVVGASVGALGYRLYRIRNREPE
ncbi:hypothetical protein [Dawidia soli]|uniref:Uncharacterized protein n=1 Tax=Dawidia soli TaxID=2782352 RepID=A0AAP2GF04_9BACT|nr:hypothetical protein [Dawidia soli]MBT1688894.1 hypothetical protein [Dawidia soli]